jgi:hypothetical protein
MENQSQEQNTSKSKFVKMRPEAQDLIREARRKLLNAKSDAKLTDDYIVRFCLKKYIES